MIQLRVIPADARPDPLFVTTAVEASFGAGFYEEEHDGTDVFRWMGERAVLGFPPDPAPRFLEYWACSEFYDLSQRLALSADNQPLEDLALTRGWAPRSVAIPAGITRLELKASKLFPREHYPNDSRTLALRLRGLRLHKDPERHAAVRRQQENALSNARELVEGRTALDSTPPSLGIDLYGTCNVKPPCVYCEWDHAKNLEGDHVDAPFTRDTLHEWGAFFDNAVSLVNCSIGEPFMMKPIDDLLDAFGDTGKVLEMTTNGQILTERNIQKLLGRPIDLYVSLDAATPVTYARLRNDTFEKILRNLRRLIEAKGGPGKLPRIHLVFMPMRCNVHELDGFVQLCADLRVDRMVLRPLNYSPSSALATDRAGYHYDYQQELLPFDELVKVSALAARLTQKLGVNLSDQMDFGGAMREMFEEAYEAPAEPEPGSAFGAGAGPRAACCDSNPRAVPDRRDAGCGASRGVTGAAVARRRAAARLQRALEEPVHPPARRHAVLLRRRAAGADGLVSRDVELAGDAGHPIEPARRQVSRLLPPVLGLSHRPQVERGGRSSRATARAAAGSVGLGRAESAHMGRAEHGVDANPPGNLRGAYRRHRSAPLRPSSG